MRFLAENEIKTLLYACNEPLIDIVECALNTGMRKGELLGLKWDQIAYHSDLKADIKLNDLKKHPVVVITHRAYEMALDFLGHEGFLRQTWSFFMSYDRGGDMAEDLQGQWQSRDFETLFEDKGTSVRRLCVVDECVDLIDHYEVTLEGLKQLDSVLTPSIRSNFKDEVDTIKFMIDLMEDIEAGIEDHLKENPKAKIEDRIVRRDKILKGEQPDFMRLISVVKGLNPDQKWGFTNLQARKNMRDKLEQTLRSLHYIFKSWLTTQAFEEAAGVYGVIVFGSFMEPSVLCFFSDCQLEGGLEPTLSTPLSINHCSFQLFPCNYKYLTMNQQFHLCSKIIATIIPS